MNQHSVAIDFTKSIAAIYIILENEVDSKNLHATLVENAGNITVQSLRSFSQIESLYVDVPVLFISDQPEIARAAAEWAGKNEKTPTSFLFVGSKNAELVKGPYLNAYSSVTIAQLSDTNIVHIIRGMLYSSISEQNLQLYSARQDLEELLNTVKNQLSVFYHNINNPLTVLSGNIQLLEILSQSSTLSNDIEKSIKDIGEISNRFETDLKIISELRESINAFVKS